MVLIPVSNFLGFTISKAPCTVMVDTEALKYLYRDPFEA